MLDRIRRSLRPRDDGQLMLLSGIVITIAFIMTSLTLSQVASLERTAAAEHRVSIAEEWRFLHQRLATNFDVAITPDTTNSTVENVIAPTIIATFRSIEAEKGYDTVIRLAAAGSSVNLTESQLRDPPWTGANYNAWDVAGTHHFTEVWDTRDDGLLWENDCADPTGPSTGCIGGVLVFVHLTDGSTTIEEVLLFRVNAG